MVGGKKTSSAEYSSTAPLNDLPSQEKLQQDFLWKGGFFFLSKKWIGKHV